MNFWSFRAVTKEVREEVSEGVEVRRVGAQARGGASPPDQTLSPKEMSPRRRDSRHFWQVLLHSEESR